MNLKSGLWVLENVVPMIPTRPEQPFREAASEVSHKRVSSVQPGFTLDPTNTTSEM
jgi:hypothetical protein